MASLTLRGGLGVGISSSGGVRRDGLEGDFGTDFVRTRGVDGGATVLADGLDGEGARERAVGGTKVVLNVGLEGEDCGTRDMETILERNGERRNYC